jgi:hypothetical protein
MRVEHQLLVLGVTLAGAIAGALTVQFGGFVDSYTQAGETNAIAQTVADATSVGGANERQGSRAPLRADCDQPNETAVMKQTRSCAVNRLERDSIRQPR